MCRLGSLLLAGLLWAAPALAFANVAIGDVVENDVLPVLTGGEQSFLSKTNINIFIFFKPGMEHSNQAMLQVAALEKEFTNRPVHWCAIVSDRVPRATVEEMVKSTELKMPVLIDQGDRLYGKLGVFLHPVVGVTDVQPRLLAYQPFAKVNYPAFIRAQLRHALGEISDAELDEVLHPVAAPLSGPTSVAHRYLRLAEKQFAATNYPQALVNIHKSLDQQATAEAYLLLGKILQAQAKPEEATAAFNLMHQLEQAPTNADLSNKELKQAPK